MTVTAIPARLGLATLLVAAGFALSSTASAQEISNLRGKPSKEQILEALTAPPAHQRVRTRGLSLSAPPPEAAPAAEAPAQESAPPAAQAAAPVQAAAAVQASAPALPQVRAVDLEIPFEFNSDRLTESGREVLDSLGQALNSGELAGIRTIVLEGHTDAKGSADYNQALSLKRARSVRTFLQSRNVPAYKLRAVGKGESELADPTDPEGAINRRVRVMVIG